MLLAIGAVMGFISVGFGAYAEHALRPDVSEEVFRNLMTAVRYNQVHAVAVTALGAALLARPHGLPALFAFAGGGLALGTALFSGGIYLSALLDAEALTYLAPFGGVTLMASWAALAIAGAQAGLGRRRASEPAAVKTGAE